MSNDAAKEFCLRLGGMVTVHQLEGTEELESRFPTRVRIAETEDEVVWAVPRTLIFQERRTAGWVTVYVFDGGENATKLIAEVIKALVAHEITVRSRKPEEGTGSSGAAPVVTVTWPSTPNWEDKKKPPIWHRLPQKQLKA